jgi:hypothetical protein
MKTRKEPTIKSESFSGKEIRLTKKQFVERWREWAFNYYNLVHWAEAKEFVEKIEKTAQELFDREVEAETNMNVLTVK